jgi:predicted HicB family RNase H-like nuclease
MSDNRSTIELDLEDDLLFELMLEAHKQDITLNRLIENILREYIAKPLPVGEE